MGVVAGPVPLEGTLARLEMTSPALKGNPLGDPAVRPLWVYTPPNMQSCARYPVVYVIQGYTGQVNNWDNRVPFRRTFPEMVDAMFADPDLPRAIVVFVDAWTKFGGSQFLDSPGTGKYQTYLCHDVVSFVDANFPTIPDAAHRAISGKSSGGYGAMVAGMTHPDVFGSVASHAGDALFDVVYMSAIPEAVRRLREGFGGSYERFLEAFWGAAVPLENPVDELLIELYGYAAAYSADDDGTVRVPFDGVSGRLDANIWQRWLVNDPVRMVPQTIGALKSLHSIWIDAGKSDEYYIDLGATALNQSLMNGGVDPSRIHFELFEGTHSRIEYRYPLAMKWLIERMLDNQ